MITYIVVNLIIILLSCNSSSNTNIYEDEKYISPIEILNKSSKSIEKLNSFYLDLSHENGFTFISTNLSQTSLMISQNPKSLKIPLKNMS